MFWVCFYFGFLVVVGGGGGGGEVRGCFFSFCSCVCVDGGY